MIRRLIVKNGLMRRMLVSQPVSYRSDLLTKTVLMSKAGFSLPGLDEVAETIMKITFKKYM